MEPRLLRADEIEVRISTCNKNGVGLLLYKDARCDMNILDETVGSMYWQRKHELINGNLFCSVGIYLPEIGWVWKQDVGVESYTEKEKGQASDSFKRACFNWGIGRELYTAPNMFVFADKLDTHKQQGNGWKCYDKFKVAKVDYWDRKITYLAIKNLNKDIYIEYGTPLSSKATESQIKTLERLIEVKGKDLNEVLQKANLVSLAGITKADYNRVVLSLKDM